jgi:hypothetical protein
VKIGSTKQLGGKGWGQEEKGAAARVKQRQGDHESAGDGPARPAGATAAGLPRAPRPRLPLPCPVGGDGGEDRRNSRRKIGSVAG